jgi:hypothetical protein
MKLILVFIFSLITTISVASDGQKLNLPSDCTNSSFGDICDEYIYSSENYIVSSKDEALNYLKGDWEHDLTAYSAEYLKEKSKHKNKIEPKIFLKINDNGLKISFSTEHVISCNVSGYTVSGSNGKEGTIYHNNTIKPENNTCHWMFLIKDEERLVLTAYDTFIPMRKVK